MADEAVRLLQWHAGDDAAPADGIDSVVGRQRAVEVQGVEGLGLDQLRQVRGRHRHGLLAAHLVDAPGVVRVVDTRPSFIHHRCVNFFERQFRLVGDS